MAFLLGSGSNQDMVIDDNGDLTSFSKFQIAQNGGATELVTNQLRGANQTMVINSTTGNAISLAKYNFDVQNGSVEEFSTILKGAGSDVLFTVGTGAVSYIAQEVPTNPNIA